MEKKTLGELAETVYIMGSPGPHDADIRADCDERGVTEGLHRVAEAVAAHVRAEDAARGGMLSAETFGVIEDRFVAGEATNEDVGAVLTHAAAQGRTIAAKDARIAELEAEVKEARSAEDHQRTQHALMRIKHERSEGMLSRFIGKANAAESALATLRQVDAESWVEELIAAAAQWGDFDSLWERLTQTARDGVERDMAKMLRRLLTDVLKATPAEHPDTATLRAIRERAKDMRAGTELLGNDDVRNGIIAALGVVLGDSGPSGGGEEMCQCDHPHDGRPCEP